MCKIMVLCAHHCAQNGVAMFVPTMTKLMIIKIEFAFIFQFDKFMAAYNNLQLLYCSMACFNSI